MISCVYVLIYKIHSQHEYKIYLENEKMAKLWVLVNFLINEGLNKYIKLRCKMKLWDELRKEAIGGRCSVKKMILKISQNLPENACVGVSFLKSCRPQPWNFINPNKAGLFEGSFFWRMGGQIDPPPHPALHISRRTYLI